MMSLKLAFLYGLSWLTLVTPIFADREKRITASIVDVTKSDGPSYMYIDNAIPAFSNSKCSVRGGILTGPYLQSGGHDRMVVKWRSRSGGTGIVCYGTSAGHMMKVAVDNTEKGFPISKSIQDPESWNYVDGAEHEVHLEGLKPNQKYYYVVATLDEDGDNTMDVARVASRSHNLATEDEQYQQEMMAFLWPDGDHSQDEEAERLVIPMGSYNVFHTFPVPKTRVDKPIKVWAFGDSGLGDYNAMRVRDAFVNFTGGDWDLSIGLGDLAYSDGRDWEFQERFFKFLSEQNARVPVFTTIGNHERYGDSNSKTQTGPYYEFFSNPGDGRSGGIASNHKAYYSFDYGPIHFVSVDSDTLGLEDDPSLYAWLEKDLAAAQKANYTWIVAYHHQPPYSKGSHDSDREYECHKLRSNLVPLFEKYGVDLVLSGHSHSYERSHLLDGHYDHSHEIHSNPSVVRQYWTKDDNGRDTLQKESCGANSGTMYIVTGSASKVGGGSLDHHAMAVSQNVLGSLLLEFHDDYSLEVTHVGTDQILDHAKISKAKCYT